jgi:carbamoyltransferase
MIYWGINALNHGHGIAVFKEGQLVGNYTGTSDEIESDTTVQSLGHGSPDRIFWYERPWVKKARQLYAGQYRTAFDMSILPKQHLRQFKYAPITYTPHHASHAAAGYYTSPFNHSAIVVLDAIGEFECATIWEGRNGKLKKLWSRSYPHSLGLFYSAFTQFVGLTPIKDEYLLQKMAEQGDSCKFLQYVRSYFDNGVVLNLNTNFHRGVSHWDHNELSTLQEQCDLAAAVQQVFEEQVDQIMQTAKHLTGADSLVYMGGCAMNSKANIQVVQPKFERIWSLPNPGDPSSSIGAVLYHTREKIRWGGPTAKHIAINI